MNENEMDYNRGYGCIVIVLSLVAIVCSMFALSTIDITKEYKNSESLMITVLGTLVTFLVAWQIWQTMVSREEIKKAIKTGKKLSKIESVLSLHENQMTNIRLLIKADFYKESADKDTSQSSKYRQYADAFALYLQAGEQLINTNMADCIAMMETILDKPEYFDDFDKRHLIDMDDTLDSAFHLIMETLNKNIDKANKLRENIIEMRNKRKALIEQFK